MASYTNNLTVVSLLCEWHQLYFSPCLIQISHADDQVVQGP